MKYKIVLIRASSNCFRPSIFTDLYLSKILNSSNIVLHDIHKKKLDIIFQLLNTEEELRSNKFIIEHTTNRRKH